MGWLAASFEAVTLCMMSNEFVWVWYGMVWILQCISLHHKMCKIGGHKTPVQILKAWNREYNLVVESMSLNKS